jgi:hypothetical protein
MSASSQKIDQSAMRFNQLSIISLVILSYVLNQLWLVPFVSAVLLVGTLRPKWSLFKQIYMRVVRPLGWMKPQVIDDDMAPHQFAQLLGGVFLGASATCLLLGFATVGWVLAWIVVALAALNFQLGFCAGCFLYYQLARHGLPGFRKPQETSS